MFHMCMCDDILRISTNAVFGVASLTICLYTYRIHTSFSPTGKRYAGICFFHLCALGTTIAFQVDSTCHMIYINWGVVLFALWLCMWSVETCTYATSHIE